MSSDHTLNPDAIRHATRFVAAMRMLAFLLFPLVLFPNVAAALQAVGLVGVEGRSAALVAGVIVAAGVSLIYRRRFGRVQPARGPVSTHRLRDGAIGLAALVIMTPLILLPPVALGIGLRDVAVLLASAAVTAMAAGFTRTPMRWLPAAIACAVLAACLVIPQPRSIRWMAHAAVATAIGIAFVQEHRQFVKGLPAGSSSVR
jgi:hypothetical protein